MYQFRNAEFIVNGLIVIALILVKIFVFLPSQPELVFNIAWFVVGSVLIIPILRIVMHFRTTWNRAVFSGRWIELDHSIYSIIGIPVTIALLVFSIYSLGQPVSPTWISVLLVSLPPLAFSRFINTMEES
ncbi:MAG TPA: hypothetical protein DCR44_06865 [Acholeplasmatales bacterium]|nr:MAG: hypothetical protein A2Y16_04725 [Tenericutes bacterium GWF2_57_13]HAQ57100.1 hypothetical protein [Acholeplasmatales bacterium]